MSAAVGILFYCSKNEMKICWNGVHVVVWSDKKHLALPFTFHVCDSTCKEDGAFNYSIPLTSLQQQEAEQFLIRKSARYEPI